MLTPYTIHADSKLKDVVKYFINKKVTGSIVINSQKDIVGILSDKDIYRGLYPSYVDFTTNPELYTDFEKQESAENPNVEKEGRFKAQHRHAYGHRRAHLGVQCGVRRGVRTGVRAGVRTGARTGVRTGAQTFGRTGARVD